MKLEADGLPEDEIRVYHVMKGLKKAEKLVLWELIQQSNKDHISLYPEVSREIRRLEARGLISLNSHYDGSEYSFFVLRNAPYLMKKLRSMSYRSSGIPSGNWKQRAKKLFQR